ncbi:MAG: hypothetical protein JWO78_1682 [Micavibrio sp.]|nr:hypothetical protein [Micavibrio sp.]
MGAKPLKNPVFTAFLRRRGFAMFKDLFNFAKTRTLKESVGFYLFYTAIALVITGFSGVFN